MSTLNREVRVITLQFWIHTGVAHSPVRCWASGGLAFGSSPCSLVTSCTACYGITCLSFLGTGANVVPPHHVSKVTRLVHTRLLAMACIPGSVKPWIQPGAILDRVIHPRSWPSYLHTNSKCCNEYSSHFGARKWILVLDVIEGLWPDEICSMLC